MKVKIMDMKKWRLAIITVLVLAGGISLLRARTRLRVPAPEQLQAAFPGDTRTIFENSNQFTLLSLDPKSKLWGYKGKNSFHGYRILGQIQASPEVKSRLIAALYDGIANSDGAAACFSPQHGIHAVQGNKHIDLVICFHCQQFITYPPNKAGYTAVAKATQSVFDRVLTEADVPLSPY
jgi:hypothetical protein